MLEVISNSQIRKRYSVCVLLGFCLIVSFLSFYKYSYNMVTMPFEKASKTLDEYKSFTNLASERKKQVKELKLGNKVFDGTYVLVIGESESKLQMGVYGSPKNTTPWQSELKKNKNSIFFDNAFSCHTHTVPVLTYALTQQNQYENSDIEWKNTVSIIDVARYAGDFNTIWLSNQQKIGINETPISSIADTANQQYFTNNDWSDPLSSVYDEILISKIKELQITSKKNLLVIHLMGCHGSYSLRYPPQYDIYNEDAEILNEYNNAIYYNDHVLEQIYATVKELPNFQSMIYFSDHGDDVNNALGHNSSSFTWDMAQIPFWMVFSDSYIDNHPEIVKSLRNNKEKAFTNDMLFETILGIIGATDLNFYNSQNDLTSDSYNHSFDDLKTLHGKKNLNEFMKVK